MSCSSFVGELRHCSSPLHGATQTLNIAGNIAGTQEAHDGVRFESSWMCNGLHILLHRQVRSLACFEAGQLLQFVQLPSVPIQHTDTFHQC